MEKKLRGSLPNNDGLFAQQIQIQRNCFLRNRQQINNIKVFFLIILSTVFGHRKEERGRCVLSIKESVFLLIRKGKHFPAGESNFLVDRKVKELTFL